MEPLEEEKKNSSSSWPFCCTKFLCFPTKFFSKSRPSPENDEPKAAARRPGGWKTMPFILGTETCERLATAGLQPNFMVFLQNKFQMEQVMASTVINIWTGFLNFFPLVGAFISDSYLGRFRTIAFGSIPSFTGMLTLTLIQLIPQLHPLPCKKQPGHRCEGPTKFQLGVLAMALGLLSIGSGSIKPCSIPFGVDQFDSNTEQGRKAIDSYFTWYYATFSMVLVISLTFVSYIQVSVSWTLGFGIPAMLMLCAIVLFFVGMKFYVYAKPDGSVFSSIAQVLMAAYNKRKLKLPGVDDNVDGVYYDPPLKGTFVKKLPLTNQFRLFNKAGLVMEGEVGADGSNSKPWRLCSIQQIEETKRLCRVIPIWAANIICFVAVAQQGTFTVSQALKMDRHFITRKFQIPPGTLPVITMITVGIWVPLYDRFVMPFVRKVTRLQGGFSLLQRIGIGFVFSIISMIAAGLTERKRRASAIMHAGPDGIAPITVFWLAPQLILMGFAEAFNFVGQIEFYNKEFPENMSSLANSLFFCTQGGGNYLSALLVTVVHTTTGGHGHPDWLTDDINAGKVENLYFLIAGLGVLNLGYFLWVTRGYKYKSRFRVDGDDDEVGFDVEHNRVVGK